MTRISNTNPTMQAIENGKIVVEDKGAYWKVISLGTEFLDWMRTTYPADEDTLWQVWYYSGMMCIIQVVDEKMMTMINLRWL